MRLLTGVLTIVLLAVALAAWIMLPWTVLLAILVLLAVAMLLTRRGRQALQVTRVGIATLPQRLGSSSVILVGIAGVVGVLVALLMPAVNAAAGGQIVLPPVGMATWTLGIALMLVIGLVVGALPALRGMRLNIVDALAGR